MEAGSKYLRKQVSELTGVPYSRVEFYQHQNVYDGIKPRGKGHSIQYTQRHVVETAIVDRLNEAGVMLAKAKKILTRLRKLEIYTGCFTRLGDIDNSKFYKRKDFKVFLVVYNNSDLDFDFRRAFGKNAIEQKVIMDKRSSAIVVDITEVFTRLLYS
jgi:DNA-binding transcriptional MerR regulator